MANRAPVYILNQSAKREQGKNAQSANIKAARVRHLVIFDNYRLSQTLLEPP